MLNKLKKLRSRINRRQFVPFDITTNDESIFIFSFHPSTSKYLNHRVGQKSWCGLNYEINLPNGHTRERRKPGEKCRADGGGGKDAKKREIGRTGTTGWGRGEGTTRGRTLISCMRRLVQRRKPNVWSCCLAWPRAHVKRCGYAVRRLIHRLSSLASP